MVRDIQNGIERRFGCPVAIIEQGIVGTVGYGVIVFPRHAVVQPPNRHPVYLVASVIENPHEFGIPVCEQPLDIIGQSILIRIQECLKLLKLVEWVLKGFSYHLSLLGDRQHIHIQLGDHHLYTKGGKSVNGGCYVLVLGEVEPPVSLDANAV